jgi:uncharacterized protein
MVDRFARQFALALIRFYRLALSPLFGANCRYLPTCSQYALDAYRTHSCVKATGLVALRLCRCHPLGGHGLDPVPHADERILT